jgi:hypothetical protein
MNHSKKISILSLALAALLLLCYSCSKGGGSSSGPEAVDLGLSVKWASYNVGGDSIGDLGGLYGWADTIGNMSSIDENDYFKAEIPATIGGTKWDIAKVRWGSDWRLPTEAEANELVAKCKWTKAKVNNVDGYNVTGPNGKSIFIAGAGLRDGHSVKYPGEAIYMTGSSSNTKGVMTFQCDSTLKPVYRTASGSCGYSVRPVFCGK